jgi:hypothetical protein
VNRLLGQLTKQLFVVLGKLAQGQKCLAQIVNWAHTGQTEIDILDQIVIGIKNFSYAFA